MFVLVRHGDAGCKRIWPLGDADRPLSEMGWEQAAGVAASLRSFPLSHLVSSPYRRCRQTLMPLADATGRRIETEPLLEPRSDARRLDKLVRTEADAGAIYCTHGETLVALLQRWHDRGTVQLPIKRSMRVTKALTAKGAGWLVHDPSGSGQLRADYLLPVHLIESTRDALGLTVNQSSGTEQNIVRVAL